MCCNTLEDGAFKCLNRRWLCMCMHSSAGKNWKQIGCLHSCMLLLGLMWQTLPCAAATSVNVLILLTQQVLLPPCLMDASRFHRLGLHTERSLGWHCSQNAHTASKSACRWSAGNSSLPTQEELAESHKIRGLALRDLLLVCDQEHTQCLCS